MILDNLLLTRILKPAVMQRAGVAFDHPTGVDQSWGLKASTISGILEAYYQAHLVGVEPTELAIIPEQVYFSEKTQ